MTEDTGWFEPSAEQAAPVAEPEPAAPADPPPADETPAPDGPAETAVDLPPVDADPQEVAEEAAAAEPPAPNPAPGIFIPTEGVAGWLRDALRELERIALGLPKSN